APLAKAERYGCGLEPVTAALAGAGCKTFFVAHLAEGRRARAAAPRATIYVLNGLLPGTAPGYAGCNLHPVIGSLAEFAEWKAFVATTAWHGAGALHVETGVEPSGVALDAPAGPPHEHQR